MIESENISKIETLTWSEFIKMNRLDMRVEDNCFILGNKVMKAGVSYSPKYREAGIKFAEEYSGTGRLTYVVEE
ncbi:MAG: hypothetical protein ACFBSE_06890, partial [Prochloraceae cyanobacterium]